MKTQIETSDGILGGRQVTFDIDLEKGPIEGNLVIDALGFSMASVETYCTGNIGTGGVAQIGQRNTTNGTLAPLSTPATINFTPGVRASKFDLSFTGRFFVIDLTTLTVTSSGRINVIIVLKL